MKKQFNRMRQLANQHVGRAEKTEVLSDDLLLIEKRLDVVRAVSHNTQKRLVMCLQGQIGTDAEKRHKKLPLTALSQCMQEGGSQLGEESLIGKMMEACSDVESKLAMELSQHEVQIEKDVLDPLNQLAEVDIPNIQKQRKQLAKLVLDWDSARARWNQATKSIISGTNFQALTAKAESLKDEMVEAGNKVELCKDQLAADMYNFFSKEGDYARYYVMLLEEQAEYHRKALAVLEKVLPTIQAQQDSWTEKPAFGTALEDHLKRSNREIALPIEACVMMLLETGMKEEGLFRIAAGQSKLKKLKAALDCSTSQLEEFYSDPHAVAGALKSYVRELPEPLMTFHLYDEWIQASNVPDPDKKLQALWVICDKLPKPNKANLRYLIKFLAKLAQESAVNKMTPSNIAIVLGPNLLWAKNEGTLAEMAAATSVHVVTIIEPIIQHADWFFPEEIDFNVSGMFAPIPSNHTNHHGGEFDCGTLERKRPVSMAVLEGDLMRKDSSSKPKDTASTPPPLRNGGNVAASGQSQPHSAGTTANQLGVGHTQNTTGPSPHVIRRATKKPAPAPPKPGNHPPAQPVSQGPPSAASQLFTQSPKPSASQGTGHSPPSQPSNQGSVQPHFPAQPSVQPRRHSSNLLTFQAPSHPPPQPPTQATPPAQPKAFSQATGGASESGGPEQSPPRTPTPPDTPPLVTHGGTTPLAAAIQPSPTSGHDSLQNSSPLQSNTLPRPRPVPKPRHRPSVPPPPQPPVNENSNGNANTASKIITDSSTTVQGQPCSFIPELPVEQVTPLAGRELNHQLQNTDHDTESTAL
ncbi:rho GTPase-activating protein 17a isoform X4 [Polyodon spathula]|uniref:rho GTPase-activating protein 17a isoform X4 n=1 Tax=Polyodon spathula TaxID=7913 RepID=UPI001B7EE7F2|nr:rho GTPase-activating protein 17a isoform X4 [Polyodon spathula]